MDASDQTRFERKLERVSRWLEGSRYGESTLRGFPSSWSPGSVRAVTGETLQDYFGRVVEGGLDQQLEMSTLEERALVLISLRCNQGTIRRLNAQAFVASGQTLVDAYLEPDENQPLHYLRLDYNPGAPGPLFMEQQPHVHVHPKGEPRIGLTVSPIRSLLAVFFDLLYRNYFPDVWMQWARRVWEEEAREPRCWDFEIFDVISDAYVNGHFGVIESEYAAHLGVLKTAIASKLDSFFADVRRDIDHAKLVNL